MYKHVEVVLRACGLAKVSDVVFTANAGRDRRSRNEAPRPGRRGCSQSRPHGRCDHGATGVLPARHVARSRLAGCAPDRARPQQRARCGRRGGDQAASAHRARRCRVRQWCDHLRDGRAAGPGRFREPASLPARSPPRRGRPGKPGRHRRRDNRAVEVRRKAMDAAVRAGFTNVQFAVSFRAGSLSDSAAGSP